MGPIEEALRDKYFPSLCGGEEIDAEFRKILGHSVKHGGLGITDPQLSAECAYNTSKAASRELVDSLLGGYVLNYVGHRECVRKASQLARLSKRVVEMSDLYDRQDQAGRQEKNRLHRATMNGSWHSAVPHRLNSLILPVIQIRHLNDPFTQSHRLAGLTYACPMAYVVEDGTS